LRLSLSVLALSMFAGCGYGWAPNQIIDTEVSKLPYFPDADDDGWGDASSAGSLLNEGGNAEFSVQNNRDCDDGNPDVTGLVGSLCPDQLATEEVPLRYGESEYVVTTGPVTADAPESGQVWGTYADDACGPTGWGGSLAQIDDTVELSTITDAVSDRPYWAGWIGIVSDGSGGWKWASGGTFDFGQLGGFCVGTDGPASPDDPGRPYLALVKRQATGSFCLGYPEDQFTNPADHYSNPAELAEIHNNAYFVCERPAPNPADYARYHLPGDADTDG
jgi:hypothetical protein